MQIMKTAVGFVIALRGRFDAEVIEEASFGWKRLCEGSDSNVYIDLSMVTFIDSAAIGLIAFLFKRLAAQRRKLCLVGANGQPRQLLELLRIDHVIELASDLPHWPAARPSAGMNNAPVPIDADLADGRLA